MHSGSVGYALLRCTGAHRLTADRRSPARLSLVVELTVVSSHPTLVRITQNPASYEAGFVTGALGGVRTHNLLIRSQMLYPVELRVHD